MVITGHTELLNAFKAHSKIRGSNLLLFYAVECGLKHLYLINNKTIKKQTTYDFDITTHNLNTLISACRLPKQSSIKSHCKTLRNSREVISIQDIHQAWRYGVILVQEDENKVVDKLENLVAYIKERT